MECHVCSRSFARPEHLRRHVDTLHGTGNEIACEVCSKRFNRKDSCQRHQFTAHRNVYDTSSIMAEVIRKRRPRTACLACARARTKCSGGARCQRCEKKQLVCQFCEPLARRRAAVASSPTPGDNDIGLSTSMTLPRPDSILEPEAAPSTCQVVVESGGSAEMQLDTAESHLLFFDDNMEYNWSDQMNWLPVMDELDLLGDFVGPAAPNNNSRNQIVHPLLTPPSPVDGASTISTNLTEVSSLSLRPVESSYVDGDGARRSVQSARQRSHSSSIEPGVLPILDLEFPTFSQAVGGSSHAPYDGTQSLSVATYEKLARQFDLLCCRSPSLFAKRFTSTRFPPHAYCSLCLTMYQASLEENLNLVHATAWEEQNDQWILVLAAITIGSRHDHTQQGHQSRVAFEEYLRRAIRNASESAADCDPLPFAQACILLAITRLNSTCQSFSESGMAEVHAACENFIRRYRPPRLQDIDPSQTDLQWRVWIAQESRCRLLWYQWLLQTFIHLFRDEGGSISLPVEDYQLPLGEASWEARTADDWARLVSPESLMDSTTRTTQTGGLRSLLYSLYAKHKLPEQVGSVSKTLLIYCLLARTAEVARSVQDPLRTWNPGPFPRTDLSEAESDGGSASPQQRYSQWLPANSIFASWRNSACDCLDTIHWAENGDVAIEKGFEKPNIFHLHLSRILLLCPYRALIDTAKRLSSNTSLGAQGFPVADLDASILQSLTLDDHKVRLSLVHAGAIFWHCRRYSRGMFYEPFGIFVSALLIVIYGIYLPQVRGALVKVKLSVLQTRRAKQHIVDGVYDFDTSRNSESEEDELMPDTILLDRPCDDEMVQIFVRKGHEMNVNMSKAGDICLPFGQRVVLDEAVKLLGRSQYVHLEDCREYSRILRRLMQKL